MLYGYLNSPFVSNPFSDAAIPPLSLTSPVISGSGVVGQTLSTTNGTWAGTLPITYTYQWNRNGSVILGATFNTYTLVTADASNSITCTVTATNAGGFASSTSNAISVAAAPVNTIAPLVTGSGVTGQTLSTTTGTWTGTAPITYAYQWKRDNTTIIGATSSTYLLVTADENKAVKCTITATNIAGSVSADSNSINVVAAGDADANAFIAAAAITNTTQKAAIDKLVVDLKGYGIWTKMKALYPFVGGTASQHKFNLKNPLDTDAAFRLVFNGGWTHSSTGALPNGTNAWANTWFKSGINFTSKDNAHYSFYSRTDLASAGIEIGADESPSNHALYTKSTSNTAIFLLNGGSYPNVAVANSLGFYQGNRNAVNTINAWKNGSKLNEMASTSAVATGAFMAISAYNNSLNSPQYYSAKQAAFASFGDGLTDTEAANYYTAVQTFQTTLGRNV